MAASIASRAVYSLSLHAHTIKSKPEVDSVVAIESELSTAFREESRVSSLKISNQWFDLPRRRTLVRLASRRGSFRPVLRLSRNVFATHPALKPAHESQVMKRL
jgi:hypothetical protein